MSTRLAKAFNSDLVSVLAHGPDVRFRGYSGFRSDRQPLHQAGHRQSHHVGNIGEARSHSRSPIRYTRAEIISDASENEEGTRSEHQQRVGVSEVYKHF